MNSRLPIRAALACAAGLIAVCVTSAIAANVPEPPAGERDGIIFERQNTMMQLDRDGEALGKIVAGLAPPDQLGAVTRSLANGAADALRDYRNKVPGGRSKPEVWSNNADFMARMEAFARNAEAMAAAGQTGNVAAVTERIIDAMPCKQCHDLYRELKKP